MAGKTEQASGINQFHDNFQPGLKSLLIAIFSNVRTTRTRIQPNKTFKSTEKLLGFSGHISLPPVLGFLPLCLNPTSGYKYKSIFLVRARDFEQ